MIRQVKNTDLGNTNGDILGLVNDVNTILPDQNMSTLRALFEQDKEAGLVSLVTDPTVVTTTPTECQQSTHDARQDTIDEITALEDAMTFRNWLQDRLVNTCNDLDASLAIQTFELQNTFDTLMLESDSQYASWVLMEADEGEDLPTFQARKFAEFN